MIYLYYTGSEGPNEPQVEIQKSIGGFISSSIIPNSQLNAVFRDISSFSKTKDSPEVICLAIHNMLDSNLENFTFHINSQITEFEILAAFVKPTTDNCGNLIFEKLRTQEQLPYYAQFENVLTEENSINIGSFEKKSYLGLFLQKRKNQNSEITSGCKAINFQELTQSDIVQELDLIFSWD